MYLRNRTIESLGGFRWLLVTKGRTFETRLCWKNPETQRVTGSCLGCPCTWLHGEARPYLVTEPELLCFQQEHPITPLTRESAQLKCPLKWEWYLLGHQRGLNPTELYCSHLFCLKKIVYVTKLHSLSLLSRTCIVWFKKEKQIYFALESTLASAQRLPLKGWVS